MGRVKWGAAMEIGAASGSGSSSVGGKKKRCATEHSLGGGWSLRLSTGPALGKCAARSLARATRAVVNADGSPPWWAVRGDVPLDEDASSACGCVLVVFSGVRMHLPEKVFGGSWVELSHAPSAVHLAFEPLAALAAWARASLAAIDDRRAGRPAWSGWDVDAEQNAEAVFASGAEEYTRREEWDWCYNPVGYFGIARAGAGAAGLCERRLNERSRFQLIHAGVRPSGVSSSGFDEADLSGTEVEWEEAAELAGAPAPPGVALEEWSSKLYEDFLSELGLVRLSVRVARYETGWEARLRWWACVNPRLEPRRGVPHARLRDVTFRWLDGGGDGGGELHRLVEERGVRLDASRAPLPDGATSLDAEAMLPLLPLTSPAVAHRARLPLPAASAPPPAAPPLVAAAPPPAADAASLPPRSGKAPRLEGSPREGSPRQRPRLSAWPAGTLLDGPVACMAVDSDTGLAAVASHTGAVVLVELGEEAEEDGTRGGEGGGGQRGGSDKSGGGSTGRICFRGSHPGCEALAFATCMPPSADSHARVHGALLSCGADGAVRSWSLERRRSDAAPAAAPLHSLLLSGEQTDRTNGRPLVQAVASCRGDSAAADDAATRGRAAGAAAAACGRSVVPLYVSRAGLLSASGPCAPLPSTVRALAYSPRGEALAAGSMHSGVFLWFPPPPPPEPSPPAIASSFSPAAAAAPPPPPGLRLPCTDEIVSLSLSSASSGALWCAARSAGRLARVWLATPASRCSSLAADAADPPRTRDAGTRDAGTRDAGPPMTFGGLSVAGAHGECHLSLHAGGRAGESRQIGSPELLVLADGARGAVRWDLSGGACAADALGVDSALASRIGGSSTAASPVSCVCLSPSARWVACGQTDGTVLIAPSHGSATEHVPHEVRLSGADAICRLAWARLGSSGCADESHSAVLWAVTERGGLFGLRLRDEQTACSK